MQWRWSVMFWASGLFADPGGRGGEMVGSLQRSFIGVRLA